MKTFHVVMTDGVGALQVGTTDIEQNDGGTLGVVTLGIVTPAGERRSVLMSAICASNLAVQLSSAALVVGVANAEARQPKESTKADRLVQAIRDLCEDDPSPVAAYIRGALDDLKGW